MNRKALRLKAFNRRTLIMIITFAVFIIFTSGIVFAVASQNKHPGDKPVSSDNNKENDQNDYTYVSPGIEEEGKTAAEVKKEIEEFVPATKMDLDPSSVTVYVNKEYSLPKDYRPENLVTPNVRFSITYYDERTLMRPEASKALEKLFQSAEKSGYYLTGVSAFRSYERQYKIFTNNLATKGKEHTLLYSAVPGTSEHQTGLAIDVSSEALGDRLDEGFADTPEGKWLAKNSYRYGFIIRYPKDMDKDIGYAYEPWHIRYVGIPLAYYLYKNKLTLDEYYKYKPSPDFNFDKVYADILNYVAPTAKVRATPTPSATPTVTPTPPVKKGDKGNPKGTKGSDNTDNTAILSITPVPTPVPVPSLAITGTPEDGSTGSDPSGTGDNADGSGTSSETTDSNAEDVLN